MEQDEPKISKYNSGINIIIRLDILWRDTHKHSRTGMFKAWNNDLDRIWVELARDLADEDYKIKKKEFDEFDNQLLVCGNFEDGAGESFELPKDSQIKNRAMQYKILMEKELFLRRLENHLGKGTAWDDGDDEDWE